MNVMKYKISIITVNLNNASGLEKTIRSIIERTNEFIEFIIVDGGSKDESHRIIEKYNYVVDKFISETDEGIFYAQNKGASIAQGEFLLFLNAGDMLVHNDIVGILQNLDADIVYGDLLIKKGDKTFRTSYPDKLYKSFLFNESLPHPSTFIDRKKFLLMKGYNIQYLIASDYDFFLKCYFSNLTFDYIEEIVSLFEKGGISSDESFGSKHIREKKAIHRKYFNLCERLFYKFFVVKKRIRHLKYQLFERVN